MTTMIIGSALKGNRTAHPHLRRAANDEKSRSGDSPSWLVRGACGPPGPSSAFVATSAVARTTELDGSNLGRSGFEY